MTAKAKTPLLDQVLAVLRHPDAYIPAKEEAMQAVLVWLDPSFAHTILRLTETSLVLPVDQFAWRAPHETAHHR